MNIKSLRKTFVIDDEIKGLRKVRNSPSRRSWAKRSPDKYVCHQLDGKIYKEHILVWAYVYGEMPPKAIDHINGNKSDNRISNLRLASMTQNLYNSGPGTRNTSGFKGVTFDKSCGLWMATMAHKGKRRTLGRFKTKEEEALAYRNEAIRVQGDFVHPSVLKIEAS